MLHKGLQLQVQLRLFTGFPFHPCKQGNHFSR